MTHYNKQCMTTVDMSTDIAEATASCFIYVLKYQRIKYVSQRGFSRVSETHRKWNSWIVKDKRFRENEK